MLKTEKSIISRVVNQTLDNISVVIPACNQTWVTQVVIQSKVQVLYKIVDIWSGERALMLIILKDYLRYVVHRISWEIQLTLLTVDVRVIHLILLMYFLSLSLELQKHKSALKRFHRAQVCKLKFNDVLLTI